MTTFTLLQGSLNFFIFPALLLAFYLVFWLRTEKARKIDAAAPQYDPPTSISPGLARYILTGGTDGTTLAAVLSELAMKGVISIQPANGAYRIQLLKADASLACEETALVQVLLGQQAQAPPSDSATRDPAREELDEVLRKLPAQQLESRGLAVAAQPAASRNEATINPRDRSQIERLLDVIQTAFRQNFRKVYFRWNTRYAVMGSLFTFFFWMSASMFVNNGQGFFVTFWLLMFTSLAGVVQGSYAQSRPKQPNRSQRLSRMLFPIMFFLFPGVMIAQTFHPSQNVYVAALLVSVALNSAFFVLLRAPTERGRKALQQIAGFREFLVRVEQDRLDRINTPAEKARVMNQYLPYAIALEIKEGWGDTMAAAFSDVVVER
jgi:predicted membrane protein DUF2207